MGLRVERMAAVAVVRVDTSQAVVAALFPVREQVAR
jgi:hypothetical protein